jgi:hypothetical protein
MFEQISEDHLDLQKIKLMSLFHSLNQPQISPGPGQGAESAEAFTMVCELKPNQMAVYVGLFFPKMDRRILYRSPIFNPEALSTQIADAESFTTQMGFLMTNLNFGMASDEEKADLTRMNPFFYRETQLYYESLSVSEIEAKKSASETVARKDLEADLHQLFFQQYVTLVSML